MRNRSTTGNNGTKRLIILQAAIDPNARGSIPPHLAEISWVDHEAATAASAYKDLRKELNALKKKISEKRVHNSRVTMRRWSAIWNVLRKDGWETELYKNKIGKPLRKLRLLLGELRDLDVNIEQGKRLGVSNELLDKWKQQREDHQENLEAFVEQKDIGKILNRLGKYLRKRSSKLRSQLPKAKAEQSAFDHIELYLLKQESIVQEQADSATTPEEFHRLRLSIKRWRYLLTEFFGVTNLELVRAQQLLGQLHDLDRLTPWLVYDTEQEEALEKLKAKRRVLEEEIDMMRRRLPYGLRPEITSIKAAFGAGLS